jgi:methionyl-tRNA synthetase
VHTVGDHIAACQFKAGIGAALALAQQTNRYLDEAAPWKTLREDRTRTATSLFVAIAAINGLKLALYPYLPFTCARLHEYLGEEGTIEDGGWEYRIPAAGTQLREPQALFRKLDPSVVEEEEARLGK